MTKNTFVCDPENLCENASCCRSIHTKPILSVGDFYRLGKLTKQSPAQVWEEAGEVTFYRDSSFPQDTFLFGLGLMHDPCFYLDDNNQCQVYGQRPLGCGHFPINLLSDNDSTLQTHFKIYQCLQGVTLSKTQLDQEKELEKIIGEEAELDLKYLWTKGPIYLNLTFSQYTEKAEEALKLQSQRDPEKQSPKSQRLIRKVNEAIDLMESSSEEVILHSNEFVDFWAPVLTSNFNTAIIEQFNRLSPESLAQYGKTSQQWVKLIQRMKKN
jgi:Fe-S-cluster containining protein